MRLAYLPFRGRRLRNKVTILSRQADEPGLDIRMLTEYLQQQYPELELRVLCRFIGAGITGKLSYLPHMLTQMRHISTSKVVVLDGYCIAACVIRIRPETKVIQMWHALAAIKKFGYQTIGRPDGHSSDVAEIMCMHKNYDYILCPSEATGRIYQEAFRTTDDHFLPIGLPRIDALLQGDGRAAAMREAYDIPEEKEIILYAPTFRKGEAIPLADLMQAIDSEKFVLVIRLHPLDTLTEVPGEGAAGGLRIIKDDTYGEYDWLLACDRMITDYSALAVEFSLTGKPLYFYVYDIDRYETSTGLNLDPGRELPQACARTAQQLQEILDRDYDMDALRGFRRKYISIDTADCTARLGDYIHGITEEIH